MSDGVEIRLAGPDDRSAFASFLREREFDIPGGTFHGHDPVDPANPADAAGVLDHERTSQAAIAVGHGRVVGSFEIRELTPELLWICSLYVAPEHRRRGLGTRLSHAVMRLLAERPLTSGLRARASYNPANRSAIGVYKTIGVVEPEPGTLEVLTPGLMRLPAFARFAARHALFASTEMFLRAVSLEVPGVRIIPAGREERGRAERYEWHGRSVYPQRFVVGDDWIVVVFAAESLLPVMVAVPSWSVEILPAERDDRNPSTTRTVRAVNTGDRPIEFNLPADAAAMVIHPGEALEADITTGSPAPVSGPLSLLLRVDGDEIKFDCSATPSRRQGASACAVSAVDSGRAIFASGRTTAIVEPAQGGSVSDLCLDGHHLLRAAASAGEEGLGWIYPWRGGLFTLVESSGPDVFRLEPWGFFPGWIGFNTALTNVRAGDGWFEREGLRGPLRERTRFSALPDGIGLDAVIHNVSATGVEAAFALFAFLDGTFVSRRSFEIGSRTGVAVRATAGTVRLHVAGGTAHAFNLGDDGVHVALIASQALQPGEELAVRARVQFAVRSGEPDEHRQDDLTPYAAADPDARRGTPRAAAAPRTPAARLAPDEACAW